MQVVDDSEYACPTYCLQCGLLLFFSYFLFQFVVCISSLPLPLPEHARMGRECKHVNKKTSSDSLFLTNSFLLRSFMMNSFNIKMYISDGSGCYEEHR